ncbi:MAG: GxxExxY protein [candidate division WOR-3 bacterium]|nr:MAG: GxxExxY protein [candidate division WOR-3 bacterium]
MKKEERDPVTEKVIAACFRVHSALGPGFVEKTYFNALKVALEKAGIEHVTEKEYSVIFEGNKVGKFRVDFLIEDQVVLEIKAIEGRLAKIFETQVISYLKAANLTVGLLVNFGNRCCEVRRLMISP